MGQRLNLKHHLYIIYATDIVSSKIILCKQNIPFSSTSVIVFLKTPGVTLLIRVNSFTTFIYAELFQLG